MVDRNHYFDFLRGIAIMMVVGIHTYNSKMGDCALAIRQVFNCAVPLFLAISGYFLASKNVSTKESYVYFIKKQLPKVYIPVLFWSLPLFVFDIIKGGSVIGGIILMAVCGYSIYYFVALIMQYYIMLPVLQRIYIRGRLWGGVIYCVSMICICIVTYYMNVKGTNMPVILYAGLFPLWIMFFYEGIQMSHRKKEYNIMLISVLLIVLLGVSFCESRFYADFNGVKAGIKPSSFIFSYFAILFLFSNKVKDMIESTGVLYKLVTKIGEYSFGIYLIHCFTISILSHYCDSIQDVWSVYWLLVLLISTSIVWLGHKILPAKIAKFIGF